MLNSICRFGNKLKEFTSSSIKAGNLRSLHVGVLDGSVSHSPVKDDYPPSITVQNLSLEAVQDDESRIIDIVNLYPNVKRLDVSYSKVTGVAVKHFVGMGVQWLNLDECPDVSPDAIEYARGKGVEVQFNFPSRRNVLLGFRDRVASAI